MPLKLATGMKLYFILTPATLQFIDSQRKNSVHTLVRILLVVNDRKCNLNWRN